MAIYVRITHSALQHLEPRIDPELTPYVELVEPTNEQEFALARDVQRHSRLFELVGVTPAPEITRVGILEGGRPQPLQFQLKWIWKDLHTFMSFSVLDAEAVVYYDLTESTEPREMEPQEYLENLCPRLGLIVRDDFDEIGRDLSQFPIPVKADTVPTPFHHPSCEDTVFSNPIPLPPNGY